MSRNQVDLLGQYIGLVLIPRINNADSYFHEGRYIDAVEKQKSVIRALFRDVEDDEEELKKWIDKIDAIKDVSLKLRGLTDEFTRNNQFKHYNNEAKRLYEEIDWEIWTKLHKFGYFSGKKMYGPNMNDINMDDAVEI